MALKQQDQVADIADLVLSIARKIQTHESHFADVVPLSNLESLVMRFVDRHPGAKPSVIGAELGLRSANLSAALRSLERQGMVRRSADPDDRRGVQVFSTRLAAENLARLRAAWAGLLGPVAPAGEDAALLVRALTEIDHAFSLQARS